MRLTICGSLLFSFWFAPDVSGQLRFMGWDDADPGASDLSPDYEHLPGRSTLVVSFQAPAGCETVQRIEAEMDFCTLPFSLTEWWRFDQADGCRYQALQVSADFSSGPTTHINPWGDPQVWKRRSSFFPSGKGIQS